MSGNAIASNAIPLTETTNQTELSLGSSASQCIATVIPSRCSRRLKENVVNSKYAILTQTSPSPTTNASTKSEKTSKSDNIKQKKKKKKKTSKQITSKNDITTSLPPHSLHNNNSNSNKPNFSSVAALLQNRKNILVLCGAGLSVSCGIPDFRSKSTGLYSTLDTQSLGLLCAEDLFDYEVFRDNPKPFYMFAKSLYPGIVQPSFSHGFLEMLQQRNMLLRVYTQNIDGLEEIGGVSRKNIVHAHGSLNWAQCMKCRTKLDASVIANDVRNGIVPHCQKPNLSSQSSKPNSKKRRKSWKEDEPHHPNTRKTRRVTTAAPHYCDDSINRGIDHNTNDVSLSSSKVCNGVIKPGVTFFGEKLDDKVARSLCSDRKKADALIVIGTSLSVAPMSKVIQYLSPSIPRILINRNHVYPPANNNHQQQQSEEDDDDSDHETDFRHDYIFDACLLGNCDDITRSLANEMGWKSNDNVLPINPLFMMDNDNENNNQTHENDNDNHKQFEPQPPTKKQIKPSVSSRTFLFPGAVLDNTNDDDEHEGNAVVVEDVVHCDGCSDKIVGVIMKCSKCFDYDLCIDCYPKERKMHFKGRHTFISER